MQDDETPQVQASKHGAFEYRRNQADPGRIAMTDDTKGGFDRRQVLKGFAGAATLTLASQSAFAQAAAKEAPDLAKLVARRQAAAAGRAPSGQPAGASRRSRRSARYGGSLRRGLRGSADHNGILRMVGNQGLVRWNLAFTEVAAQRRREVDGQRQRDRVHLHAAQGHEVVGRQALHGRRRRLRHRGLRQEHRALQVRRPRRSSSAASRARRRRSTTPP